MKTKYLIFLSLLPGLARAASYGPLLNCAALIQDKSSGRGGLLQRTRIAGKENQEYLLQLPNSEELILYQTNTSYRIPISKNLESYRKPGIEELRIATKIPVAGNPDQIENMIAIVMKKEKDRYTIRDIGPVQSEAEFKKSTFGLNLIRSETQKDDSTRAAFLNSLSERIKSMQTEYEQQKKDFQQKAKEHPQGVKGNTVTWAIELGNITTKNPSFEDYKKALDICHEAGVTIPASISQYFSSAGKSTPHKGRKTE